MRRRRIGVCSFGSIYSVDIQELPSQKQAFSGLRTSLSCPPELSLHIRLNRLPSFGGRLMKTISTWLLCSFSPSIHVLIKACDSRSET